MTENKILGEERRNLILHWLQTSKEPITGSELAAKTNVSRQVIVSDITLLKARDEPIIATSQGYMYLQTMTNHLMYKRTVACCHTPQQTEEEMNLLVDHGVTIKDVRIEHSVYGDLTASIMVSNRKEVQQFMKKIKTTKASYLSELTNGIHLHTISADSEETLDEAVNALRKANFIIE